MNVTEEMKAQAQVVIDALEKLSGMTKEANPNLDSSSPHVTSTWTVNRSNSHVTLYGDVEKSGFLTVDIYGGGRIEEVFIKTEENKEDE